MYEFKFADVVECVDATPILKQTVTMPEKGRLYRIESVKVAGDGHSVRLLELTPNCYLGGFCSCGNCGWDSRRFRRIRLEDSELAIFRAMLEPSERRKVSVPETVN